MESELELSAAERALAALESERLALLSRIRELRRSSPGDPPAQAAFVFAPATSALTHRSSQEEKIALFRSLFQGRADVFARRFHSAKTGRAGYAPVCRNEWREGVCLKPSIRCEDCAHRAFVPISDDVIRSHLLGVDPSEPGRDFTVGLYVMLKDETCWLLAADFDKSTWQDDALAFVSACRRFEVPAAMERSRSGNGAHVWVFFAEAIPAEVARRLGTCLISNAMDLRPELGLDSYDRLFPSQDTLPKGGFGSLIALPLQHTPRSNGNSVFVDDTYVAYPDQWAFLSSLRRMSRPEVDFVIDQTGERAALGGIRTPDGDDAIRRYRHLGMCAAPQRALARAHPKVV